MIGSNTLLKFQRLRQGNTVYGLAPHKPILLLAVIYQMENYIIYSVEIINIEL